MDVSAVVDEQTPRQIAVGQLRRDPQFYKEDGDTVILVEDTLFKVFHLNRWLSVNTTEPSYPSRPTGHC